MYIVIIVGQVFPKALFPNSEISQALYEKIPHIYAVTLPEVFISFGAFVLSLIIITVGMKVLRLLPNYN